MARIPPVSLEMAEGSGTQYYCRAKWCYPLFNCFRCCIILQTNALLDAFSHAVVFCCASDAKVVEHGFEGLGGGKARLQ